MFNSLMLLSGRRRRPPDTAYVTGDRRSSIAVTSTFTPGGTLSNIVDGDTAGAGPYIGAGPSAGEQWRFDFGGAGGVYRALVHEARLYMEDTRDEGLWKWRGTNDLVNFNDLTGNLSIAGATMYTHTGLALPSRDRLPFRYLVLEYVSGNQSGQPRWQEIEFKQALLLA
jgi:hypothetical protein